MGGMLIDAISIFYIFLPIFMPIIEHFGWDPVWFGVVMTLNLAVGQFTPPVAVNLYVTTQLANIRHKVPTTAFILLSRALFAAVVIVIITAMAKTVGSRWSGIFAAFPTTVLPTVWVLHYHYGSQTISALFREIPLGMLAIVIFSCSVYFTFPQFGVYSGIFISYGVALLYLLFYEFLLRRPLDNLLPGISKC